MRCFVTLALGLLVLAPASAAAAIRYVLQSGTDVPNTTCLQATPCRTVQKAIQVASPGDTIRIGKGKFFESGILVDKQLTIEGQGIFKTWIVGSPDWGGGRVFTIMVTGDALIRQMQIQKGVGDQGGGIRNQGELELEDVWIRQNRADDGGGIYNDGELTLRRVEIALNRGTGGLYNTPTATTVIIDSRIAANRGGGIFNVLGTVTMVNSIVAANVSAQDARAAFGGTGVLSHSGEVTLINSTISGNRGSGLHVIAGGLAVLSHVTIAENTVGLIADGDGSVTMMNTILAQNKGDCLTGGGSVAGITSLVGFACLTWPTGDNLIDVDPKLAGLAPNDHGIAWTHAPLPGSPAIDAASAEHCLPVDQRGVTRPRDGDGDGAAQCDIGALEVIQPGKARGGRDGR